MPGRRDYGSYVGSAVRLMGHSGCLSNTPANSRISVSARRDLPQSEEHRAEVGNQPYQPYGDTEPVEVRYPALVSAQEDHRRPDSMHEHENDGDHASHAVDVKRHPSRHLEHHPSSPCIADESQPKEDDVPPLQSPLNALAPYADRIEDERQTDDRARGCSHSRPFPLLVLRLPLRSEPNTDGNRPRQGMQSPRRRIRKETPTLSPRPLKVAGGL